jgi:hypothetical protein
MNQTLCYISPEMLTEEILEKHIYPNLDIDYYWSDCWTGDFYRTLARAGFIPVALQYNAELPLLIPEMQKSYAVLDWENLHVSRHARRGIRSGKLAGGDIYLSIDNNTDLAVEKIRESYREECWLIPAYRRLAKELEAASDDDFSLVSVLLRSGAENGCPLAGELGYTTGAIYTSLSGFTDRSNSSAENMGTIQLLALAKLLARCGYAFWNLGHPSMPYKSRLGARILPRPEFLSRWKPAVSQRPARFLDSFIGEHISCQSLFDND